jgi:hypothetical protein
VSMTITCSHCKRRLRAWPCERCEHCGRDPHQTPDDDTAEWVPPEPWEDPDVVEE